MSPRLPAVTHLQFLVLEALAADAQAGRDLRAMLASYGVRNSGPAFYQMMARLEESSLVEGEYTQKIVDSQHLKERRYRLTRSGKRSLEETRAFYAERLAASRLAKKPSHA